MKRLSRTQENRILPLLPVFLALIGMALIVIGEPMEKYGFVSAGTWIIFGSSFICVLVMMTRRTWKENFLLLLLCAMSCVSLVVTKAFSYTSFVSLFCFWELPIFLFYIKGGYRKQLNVFIFVLFFMLGIFFISRCYADNAYIIMGPYGPVKVKELMLGYSNPNKTSMYLICTLFVLVTAVFYFRNWLVKIPFAMMASQTFWMILKTLSRMGTIMSIFFLCLFVIPKIFAKSRTIKFFALLVPLAFFLFVVFGESIHGKITILGDTFDSNRMQIYEDVLANLSGLKWFFGDFSQYSFKNMHNVYVGVLATTGSVGLCVFALCLFDRVLYLRAFVERAYQKIAVYALLVLVAYSSVEASLFTSGSSFAMFIVALYCLTTEKKREPLFGWRTECQNVVAAINMTVKGSTGKIMLQIADKARENGFVAYTYSTNAPGKRYRKLPKKPKGHYYFGSYLESCIHFVLAYLFGRNGTYSRFATYRLLRRLEKYKPGILHLHNLHNYCINLPMLFAFIKKHDIRVVWTLHDCWAFTGHCPYYDIVECQKWTTGCKKCAQYRNYPSERIDTSRVMYAKKKEWFTGVLAMTLVTPSEWLAGEVKRSFLKEYTVRVIYNGIDLSIFQPKKSDFRKKYGIKDEFVLLGVAFSWGKRKGLDVFIELAKRLNGRFKIVLVGTDARVDAMLPDNVISIHRTQNQAELAEVYTACDLFVNPTREEVFGLVNVESLACGTPVVTFRTGGSPECIDARSGVVVEKNDIDGMVAEIERIERERLIRTEDCIARAQAFDMQDKFEEYIRLYRYDGE